MEIVEVSLKILFFNLQYRKSFQFPFNTPSQIHRDSIEITRERDSFSSDLRIYAIPGHSGPPGRPFCRDVEQKALGVRPGRGDLNVEKTGSKIVNIGSWAQRFADIMGPTQRGA